MREVHKKMKHAAVSKDSSSRSVGHDWFWAAFARSLKKLAAALYRRQKGRLTDGLTGRPFIWLLRTEDERASQFAPGRSLYAAPLFGHRSDIQGWALCRALAFVDIDITGLLLIFARIF